MKPTRLICSKEFIHMIMEAGKSKAGKLGIQRRVAIQVQRYSTVLISSTD